jgi:hypothetical protein
MPSGNISSCGGGGGDDHYHPVFVTDAGQMMSVLTSVLFLLSTFVINALTGSDDVVAWPLKAVVLKSKADRVQIANGFGKLQLHSAPDTTMSTATAT